METTTSGARPNLSKQEPPCLSRLDEHVIFLKKIIILITVFLTVVRETNTSRIMQVLPGR
jgi:hypothetical protein